jgi:hypothetical protein
MSRSASAGSTGEQFFQHAPAHERSDLSQWRGRLRAKLGLLLAETLRISHHTGALRTKDLAWVTVDTAVQHITRPRPSCCRTLASNV